MQQRASAKKPLTVWQRWMVEPSQMMSSLPGISRKSSREIPHHIWSLLRAFLGLHEKTSLGSQSANSRDVLVRKLHAQERRFAHRGSRWKPDSSTKTICHFSCSAFFEGGPALFLPCLDSLFIPLGSQFDRFLHAGFGRAKKTTTVRWMIPNAKLLFDQHCH